MFADAVHPHHSWPDGIDWVVTLAYIALIISVLAAGYACMVLDFRAYLRSLRRALVLISHYRFDLPAWAQKDHPRCIEALGLTLPCTADEVLAAYRLKVKAVHPDLGGDSREFLRLQQHFEQAMAMVTKE